MILTIQRETLSPATMGRLFIDGAEECDTLELPWKDNKSGESCVPPGTYQVGWEKSPRLQRFTLRLQGVPGRWGILIHPANLVGELKGCIALGKRLHTDQVFESRVAVQNVEAKVLYAIHRGEAVQIQIMNPVVA